MKKITKTEKKKILKIINVPVEAFELTREEMVEIKGLLGYVTDYHNIGYNMYFKIKKALD